MRTKLKACPFCGDEALVLSVPDEQAEASVLSVPDEQAEGWVWYRVACKSCLIGTSRIAGRDNAIKKWNCRIGRAATMPGDIPLHTQVHPDAWGHPQVEKWYRMGCNVLRVVTMWSISGKRGEGHVEVFSQALQKWERLVDLPYSLSALTKILEQLSFAPPEWDVEIARQQDEDELLRLAALVLKEPEE